LKQAVAFNVICSTFIPAHLEVPSLKKTLDISELDKAKQVLLAKEGLGRLVMNLTGSVFVNIFVRLLGNHSMILFL
jgi:hypothetical protein